MKPQGLKSSQMPLATQAEVAEIGSSRQALTASDRANTAIATST